MKWKLKVKNVLTFKDENNFNEPFEFYR